jgi:hypothetical protein
MSKEQKARAWEMGLQIQRDLKSHVGEILSLGDLERTIAGGMISAVNKELVRLSIYYANAIKGQAKTSHC